VLAAVTSESATAVTVGFAAAKAAAGEPPAVESASAPVKTTAATARQCDLHRDHYKTGYRQETRKFVHGSSFQSVCEISAIDLRKAGVI
jgi:hypothetical protein